MIPSFRDFLNSKSLYYKEIDTQRVHRAYARLSSSINRPETIHIVGTNGKGSTGRIVAHLAHQSGLKVGHYSSPHLLSFNERIWVNGEDSSDLHLELAHTKLYGILGEAVCKSLSYFEYTTLLAFVIFEPLDLVVLEAGLGGEFDATNVCDKELSIIVPIDFDHRAFLGDSIREIATTKIRSIQKEFLLAPQNHLEVIEVAQEIASTKNAKIHYTVLKTKEMLPQALLKKNWPSFLNENCQVAMRALNILGIKYDIKNLQTLQLVGRYYQVAPNIHIDVGHNPLAALALAQNLEKNVILVYNTLDDKDYGEVLRILKPHIKMVQILPIYTKRAVEQNLLEAKLEALNIPYSLFDEHIDTKEKYLVFGSFYVVERFLIHFRN